MRRGRSGIGGWRSDNPRLYRPRGGGPQHLKAPRHYGLTDAPRFPPPGVLHRPPFIPHHLRPNNVNESGPHERHDRNNYTQFSAQHRPSDRGNLHQRQISPYFYKRRQNNEHSFNVHQNINSDEPNQGFHGNVNDMGDIDHRQHPNAAYRDTYGKRHTTWINPALDNRRNYYDNSPQKHYKNNDGTEPSGLSTEDYSGHRPPSSDYYGDSCNATDNNKAFSRSVDDTVDIIRKRLRDRSDGQFSTCQESQVNSDLTTAETNETFSENQQEQTPKRRIQRPAKSNCDKIKNNIIRQLFKMDKNKIHKLMDNPSSSTKFDYAMSSLITESQNSLNRQLRSVAEKSLNSSSNIVNINDDGNTIYEDTFIKQMQCILDPQDTVFLEDMKPLVMAELNKLLQLDIDVPGCDIYDGNQTPYQSGEQQDESYYHESSNYGEQLAPYNYENKLYEQELASELYLKKPESDNQNDLFSNKETIKEQNQLYEMSQSKLSEYPAEVNSNKRYSTESQRSLRRSTEKANEDVFSAENLIPLFDTSADQLSGDEDPFAELDKQYHVAVDHNFINNDFDSPNQSVTSSRSPNIKVENSNTIPMINYSSLEDNQEINSYLEGIANCELNLKSSPGENKLDMPDPTKNVSNDITETGNNKKHKTVEVKTEAVAKTDEINNETVKTGHCRNTSKFSTSNSRKRVTNEIPSHRKEKRKRSESSPAYLENQDTNKINSARVTKNEFVLTSPKESKDTRNIEKADKTTTEKYVKRKKEVKKLKDTDLNKKSNSNNAGHSILSPKDSSSSSNNSHTKSDTKNKLKPIDMFVDQPKKCTQLHQAHRNTAGVVPAALNKSTEDSKTKHGIDKTKVVSKSVNHVATQVMRKMQSKEIQTVSKCTKSRFSQTEKKKMTARAVQTDPVFFEKGPKATDSFERMKEIDLEIQVLLQEKFKLYNSIESRESQSTMQTLGMTVLNVTPVEEEKPDDVDRLDEEEIDNALSEDAIVDRFTSIPVEELEEIALETVEHDKSNYIFKSAQHVKCGSERSSASPTITKSGRKVKPPNISLLEQIITSDKPLEDIIVLDELENPVKATKKKSQKKSASKKRAVRSSKARSVNATTQLTHIIKECSVVLERLDINQYLIQLSDLDLGQNSPSSASLELLLTHNMEYQLEDKLNMKHDIHVNDIQLDMLDVSEDIVIGDVCEVKCDDSGNSTRELISEEIILDNSQSSCEEEFNADTNQDGNVCKVFDYSNDVNLMQDCISVTGNNDAVLAVESVDNSFIIACLDGGVFHYNSDGRLIKTLRSSNLAVTCITIAKESTGVTVFTGSLDSRIRQYDLETGVEKGAECNVLSPIQSMDRAWDTVFVGTKTGFVLQFECKNNLLIPVSSVKYSDQTILALRAIKEGPRKVLLVAARAENVTIRDALTGLLLRSFIGPKMTVYTLLFEDGKVFCGTSSHQVHVFDYASGSHVGAHEGGKGAVCLRTSGGLLFTGCYDGCVYVYREGEPRPFAQMRGPSLMLLSLAIIGTTKIVAGYKDRSFYIWKIPLSILREMIL